LAVEQSAATETAKESCVGSDGYYPRAFFLNPRDVPEVEVAIVGKNPGYSSPLEREFYKVLGEPSGQETHL
jgi:hypothetical protein